MAFRIVKNKDGSVKKTVFSDAHKLASEERMGLLPNTLAGVLSKHKLKELGDSKFWTGSIVAYPAKGKAFGDKIVSDGDFGSNFIIDTTMFAGMRGTAIVLDSDNYDLKVEGRVHTITPKIDGRIDIVYNFPQSTAERFAIHETTGLTLDIRGHVLMYRREEATVAAVVRSFDEGQTIHLDQGFGARHAVVLTDRPSIPPKSSASS